MTPWATRRVAPLRARPTRRASTTTTACSAWPVGRSSATFLYDADGNRVKGTVAGVTTVYHRRAVRVPEWRGHQILRRRRAPADRLRDRQRRVLHPERPVALDQRAGQPERHGQQPQLTTTRTAAIAAGARSAASRRNGSRASITSKGLPGGEGLSYLQRALV